MAVHWRGVFPAATTRFHADQAIDIRLTLTHLDKMIEAGIHGLIMLGTVGENCLLEYAEKLELHKATVGHVKGRVPVLTGMAECRSTVRACEWEKQGLLFAYRSKEQMDAYAPTDKLMGESFHCPAQRYDGDAVAELEPVLKPGLAGGWFYHNDSHLRPDKLLASWRKVLEASGVSIRENCGFRSFRRQEGQAVAADTEHEGLTVDAFVVATGAWTPMPESGVRYTHLPTGVAAESRSERSQHKNDANAMALLKAKLIRMEEEKREAEYAKKYDEKGDVSFGNQIRSYVLQPYQLVKDLRTGFEVGNPRAVLDGGIDGLIESYLRMKLAKGSGDLAKT